MIRSLLLLLAFAAAAAPAQSRLDIASGNAAATITPAVNRAVDALAGDTVAVVPPPRNAQCRELAAALIVRWEVTSHSYYDRRLIRPIWPQGASGVTWGIGYDGGHQTARDIRAAWSMHAEVDRLAETAGLVGDRARTALPAYRDIVTPYPMAYDVFAGTSLPAYRSSTRTAFRAPTFDALPADAQGALVSLIYNRGASMTGSRNAEKRDIRDVCLPAADVRCIATKLRAMCRLWAGTPNGQGLCNRREDEARLAESAA